MNRILIYSHDGFGLGNIRRMLRIATHMAGSLSEVSVLVLSGSPMVQGFRIAPHIDYIKLPSVTRTERDGYATRSLGLAADDTFELRANMILAAVVDFRPDVILVDKKPLGMHDELEAAIYYTRMHRPQTGLVLVLRDILDQPQATIRSWRAGHYTESIERYYDSVLVLGSPDVFDMRREYDLPEAVCRKLRFCGYVTASPGLRKRDEVRRELGVGQTESLVLVTPGGGEDGVEVIDAYAAALPRLHASPTCKSLIVTGPEMPAEKRHVIEEAARTHANVTVREFTDDMMSYMDAADVVVAMGGYNTVCEIATLRKRAVVVPRVRPVQEQGIRASRLASLGLLRMIHPDTLTPNTLANAVERELEIDSSRTDATLDLNALPRVTRHVTALLDRRHAIVGAPVSGPEALSAAVQPSIHRAMA
jgi:predicted glycosyltransferase